jgi:hypothetical protein
MLSPILKFPVNAALDLLCSRKQKLVTYRNIQYVELYDLVIDPLKKMLKQWQSTLPAKPTGNVFSKLRKRL